jgi:integrase
MARPKNTKKDSLPILEDDFNLIIRKTKKDKSIKSDTKKKIIRAYTLLYCLGCRISEITNLTVDDIKSLTANQYLILTKTKTNTIQRLTINDKIVKMIEQLDFSDCEDYIFYKPNHKNTAIKTAGLTKLLNTYLAKQLNPLYTSHSFRGGYITRIIEATGNIATAQKLARHRSKTTTMGYIGSTQKQQDDALNKIF